LWVTTGRQARTERVDGRGRDGAHGYVGADVTSGYGYVDTDVTSRYRYVDADATADRVMRAQT
jgi:hypothetical protein